MEVDVATEPTLTLGQPKQLFVWPGAEIWNYAVAPDGERFVGTQADEETEASRLVVVQNWFEEFRQR